MTQRERMDAGLIYDPIDPELRDEQQRLLEMLYDYNAARPSELEKRQQLLAKMLGAVGDDCYIEPPFYANWGGKNVYMGKGVYVNFNLTLVDDADIIIGDKVMIGPNVTIATAGHPILPVLREKGLQYNKPVHIGRNVWIGAGSIILPGVTIGDNSVIGAGSVVTKDIPADTVAVGSPCRVMRQIGERDREFFYRSERIDYEELDC